MKKIISYALLLFVLLSCTKENPYMTKQAIAAVDRFCGEYQIISIETIDGAIDLDGDGIRSVDLMSEMQKTGWLGYSNPFDELLSVVNPKTDKGRTATIQLFFPTGAVGTVPDIPQTACMVSVLFAYDVDDEGIITAPVGAFFGAAGQYDYNSVQDVNFEILDNWDLGLSGIIYLYDRSDNAFVYRRVRVIYHCVSTKQKTAK